MSARDDKLWWGSLDGTPGGLERLVDKAIGSVRDRYVDPGFEIGNVPCNGCTSCCHNDAVRLLAGDDPDSYKTEPHPYWPGSLMLAHKPNGECIYLRDGGCSIHDTRPQQCREMDCRLVAMRTTFTKAKKLDRYGALRMSVWWKGRRLLREVAK